MKFKIQRMFLSLFFALAFCFLFSIQASAHMYTDSDGNVYEHSEDINVGAADVGIADEAQMKKFVRHIATHLDLINKQENLDETKQEKSRELAIFGSQMVQRAEEGEDPNVLNHGDVYTVVTLKSLKGAIATHGLHPNLYGHVYDSSQDPLQTLLDDTIVPEFSDTVDPHCVTYDNGNRVACAVGQQAPVGPATTIAGFHHAEEKDPVVQAPDCSDFIPPVTAMELENETDPAMKKELLKQFVKGAIGITSKIYADAANKVLAETSPLDPAFGAKIRSESIASFFPKTPCFRELNFRYGSIYAFIMDPLRGVAFMSGNDFTRNGLSVSLNDPNPVKYDGTHTEPNVLTAIHRTLTDTPPPDTPDLSKIKHGDSGFFRYHWAHPINTELNTPDYLERGETPGRALKESYIEVADLYADPSLPQIFRGIVLFVFGSGIYLEEEDDDDGCSIAATGNTPQSALLNLVLIASVLFSVVFLRKRG